MSHHAKRIDGLVEETIEGELLVYNPATAEAHALNPTAAAVFRLCDGDTDRDAMVAALADHLRLPADGAWVDLALAELRDAGLVAGGDGPSSMTRRAVVRALGLTTMAAALLPVVETMTARPAAAQGSSPSPTPGPSPTPTPGPSPSPTPGTPTPSPSPSPTPGTPTPTPSPFPS